MMFQRGLIKLFLFLCIGQLQAAALPSSDIVKITTIQGKNYYHIQYELNKTNFKLNRKFGFNEGGMFELFISKELFPIVAPKCRKHIILRMPWTDDTKKNSTQFIEEKKTLYQRLENIGNNKISVIVELNPYIKLVEEKTNRIELTRCNVFFRQSGGRYISTL